MKTIRDVSCNTTIYPSKHDGWRSSVYMMVALLVEVNIAKITFLVETKDRHTITKDQRWNSNVTREYTYIALTYTHVRYADYRDLHLALSVPLATIRRMQVE